MKRSSLFIILLLVLSVSCGPAAPVVQLPDESTPAPGALIVKANKDLGPISPYIYGSNHGPWTAVPADMIQFAVNSHISIMRWPGGAWGDENDIQTYQLDTFMALCKQMNTIPTINVRLRNGTPEAAAELVRYANTEMKYGITYWGIGNEPTLYEQQSKQPYDTVRFNQEWGAIARAMKAVDPAIKVMGPELHQWGTSLETTLKDSAGRDWMTEFLKANGDLVDIVTVHRYPHYSATGEVATVDFLRKNTLEWNAMVDYLRGLIKSTTGRDIPIAFTEVNSDPTPVFGGAASPDSFYNAIWYADVLGRLIDENVFMVNHFLLANRTGGLGLIYNGEIRPTYYVYQMYNHFGSQRVDASSGVAEVTVYAAKRADGTLTIMVINLADTEQRVLLQVEGKKASRAQVWLFDAAHNASDMGEQPLPADDVLTLPAQSVSLYAIAK